MGSNTSTANSLLIGEYALTLDAGVTSGATTIGYYLKPRSAGTTAAKFYNNFTFAGTQRLLSYVGADSANVVAGAFAFNNVTLTVVPEPSAFGMVMLGALGLVGFRRLGLRRTA